MTNHVLAIDPGKMTGFAYVNRSDGTFLAGELAFDGTCDMLEGYASAFQEDLTVFSESFIINAYTAKNTQAPWSLELIGVARRTSRKYTGRDLALQSPSQAKGFSSDDRLKKMGWYTPGKGHANDASRHLLLACVSRGWVEDKVLKSLVT